MKHSVFVKSLKKGYGTFVPLKRHVSYSIPS